jgi:hypothetical protein
MKYANASKHNRKSGGSPARTWGTRPRLEIRGSVEPALPAPACHGSEVEGDLLFLSRYARTLLTPYRVRLRVQIRGRS